MTYRTSFALVAVALSLAVPVRSAAQAPAPSAIIVRPGELVRLRTSQWEYTGTFARIAADTALVRFASDSAFVPRSQVVRVQVQRGTRRSATRIALMSLAGGAAGGIIGGFLGVSAECGSSCSDDPEYSGLAGGIGGFGLGAIVGLVGGGIYGARKRYPRWQDASLP